MTWKYKISQKIKSQQKWNEIMDFRDHHCDYTMDVRHQNIKKVN